MRRVPWWEPRLGEAPKALVASVVDSRFVNDGEVTAEFERRIARLLGCCHVVAVTSGTCALFAALKALDVGPGDEVVVPDATFIATANAVAMTGAKAVLADIDAATLTLAPDAFARAITSRTKAVIPVHVSGRAADMDSILSIAGARGIEVVEDAAEAFMSKRGGRFLGTIARMGCFSFSPLKVITTGQGGAVVTDDDALHDRLRELKDQGRLVRSTGVDAVIPRIGYNFKLTNLQAALGLGQLDDLEWRMQQMRRLYRGYVKGLDGLNGVAFPGFRIEDGELPLWTDVLAERRDELDAFLAERGIDCRRFWYPLHTQPSYRAADGGFPNATRAMAKALWLPAAFGLGDDDVAYVCESIRAFYGGA